MDMAGSDWTDCVGEVFQIYRKVGPGFIASGDNIGLYYLIKEEGTGKEQWLGCGHLPCGKYPCPGTPNPATGFEFSRKWTDCGGEIFRIYARGKDNGMTINSDDDVAVVHSSGKWLCQGYKVETTTSSCFGTSFPPPESKFDDCGKETFRIWKK